MKICPDCKYCYEDTDVACTRGDHAALIPSRHGSRIIAEKYRLDRLLGRGGMGAVYAGTHVELDRPVAVKLLLPDLVSDAQALERFRREARAAARLNHPNVVDTYDYGLLSGGEAYIVMELVEGQTLREYMNAAHALPFNEASGIARQVADGIEVAHRNGIVHRDLKPSNIILTRDHHDLLLAKVVDFGIAKLKEYTTTGGGDALTNAGSLIGTPRYMSPEQCSGGEIDARTDIYSLGVILYEMLAGRPPFDASSATGIALKHMNEPPPPLRDLRPDVPEMLEAVVAQSLEKEPQKRQETAAEFARGLRAYEDASRRIISVETENSDTTLTAPDVFESSPLREPDTGAASLKETGAHKAPQATDAPHTDHSGTNRVGSPTQTSAEPTHIADSQQNVQEPAGVSPPHAETITQISHLDVKSPEARAAVAVAHESPVTRDSSSGDAAAERDVEPGTSRLLIFGGIVAAFVIGLGILWAVISRRDSREVHKILPVNMSSLPAPNAVLSPSPAVPNQTQADAPSLPAGQELIEPPADAQTALRASLNGWIAATTAKNINRQMNFYAPRLSAFYLAHDVGREAVRSEKETTFAQTRSVRMNVSDVSIKIAGDGRTALMRFRKEFEIEGTAQNRNGEVLQELVWVKTKDGWRITSERDLQVLR